jgi:phage terminase Nu1 subunit (DNA packaging protein)
MVKPYKALSDSAALIDITADKYSQLFLSKESLAKILDVSPRTVGTWRYVYPDFPARKVGRHVRYRLPEVLKWLEQTFGS